MNRTGLSQQEAARRLAVDGPNSLPQAGARPIWKIVAEVMREPMLVLLLVGGVAYLLLGDLVEALILLVFASFSVLSSLVIISVFILFVLVNATLLKFSALDRLDFLIALTGSTAVLLFLQSMKLIMFTPPPRITINP